MANNLDDLTAIRSHFIETWDATVPVVFDNAPLKSTPSTLWARFSVSPGAQKQIATDPPKFEQLGRAYLQVFVPQGQYDQPGWEIANAFCQAFRETYLDNYRIRFRSPEYRTQDATPEEPFFMILVSVPYRSDQ